MERANAYDAQSLSFMGVTTIGLSAAGYRAQLPFLLTKRPKERHIVGGDFMKN